MRHRLRWPPVGAMMVLLWFFMVNDGSGASPAGFMTSICGVCVSICGVYDIHMRGCISCGVHILRGFYGVEVAITCAVFCNVSERGNSCLDVSVHEDRQCLQ